MQSFNTPSEVGQFVRDELERNFACSQGEDATSRLHNILAMENRALRLGESALLEGASFFPLVSRRLLGLRKIATTPYAYIGAGSENTTITDGEEVLKLHRASVRWDESDRQRFAQQTAQNHATMRVFLGSVTVPQITSVGTHPLRRNKRVVQTRQLRLKLESIGVFHPFQPIIVTDDIEALTDKYPDTKYDLHDFAQAGLAMFEQTEPKLLVDCSGLNNVAMADRDGAMRLTCVDSSPIVAADQGDITRITEQLYQLKTYLEN